MSNNAFAGLGPCFFFWPEVCYNHAIAIKGVKP